MDSTVQYLRDHLIAGRQTLLSTPPGETSGQELQERHADLIDETVSGLYDVAVSRAKQASLKWFVPGETEIAIVATGGYGRRELSPFSDVDIAFIPSAEDQPYVDVLVKEAFQLIMDIFQDHSNLHVGYAYRPLSDCPRLDHETKTSLLDMRLVAGAEYLIAQMRRELLRFLDVVSFLQEKTEERRLLFHRFRSGLYSLEPDLKEGSGGLRDLHSAMWMAQVMFRVPHEEVLHEMIRRGVIAPRDYQNLLQARERLWRIRNWLHLTANKKNDVLVSDVHDRIARDFGYAEGEGGEKLPSARFMADYYATAETVNRFSRKVAKRFLEGTLNLGRGFVATRQRLGVSSPDLFSENPALVISFFELAHRYGFYFDLEAEVLLEEALSRIDDSVRSSRDAAKAFLTILRPSSETGHTLRRMRDRGVLQSYLPEFGDLMRCVPADPAHELTVGEHSLRVVDFLVEISETGGATPSLLTDAIQEINEPEILFLAALLHDVGKAVPGGDHSVTGAETARRIGDRLGLNGEQKDILSRLVQEHLTLVRISRLRDLNSPTTLKQTMEAVGNRQMLKMLYLLSYADTKAVGTRAYTEVDMRLLDDLYLKVNRAFCEETLETDIEARAITERARVRTELTGLEVPDERLKELSERLPASYVVNTPFGLIATHLKLLDRLETERVVADFYTTAGDDFTELTICAYDDPEPGMLSKITGTLYANDIDIRTAQVFTLDGNEQIVLDTLWVAFNAMPLSEAKADRMRGTLRGVLSRDKDVEAVIAESRKPLDAQVWVEEIEARNDLSEEHTVIHLVAGDVKGLLYFITRALAQSGLDIHTAKIMTWSGKAEDAFYVTLRDGSKVPDQDLEAVAEQLKESLTAKPSGQLEIGGSG